jgi:hypothetical protein
MSTTPDPPRPAVGWLLGLAAVKLAIHALTFETHGGYFRDELYFLDCGRHLDWGYVDHAPMIGWVARLALLLGGSLPALRVFPALAGALLVVLAGLLAWRLGGGRFAQILAGLAVLVAPLFLAVDSFLSMNAFEPLFWMGGAYVLVRVLQGADPRLWLAFGALAGLGLLNKHSTLFFGFAVFAGLLLSRERVLLRTRWPWLAGGLALLLFLPNLVWQARHDFATLEDLRNVARQGKNVVLGPVEFFATQVLVMHPALFPLWLGGLVALLRGWAGRYRALGLGVVVLFITLFALKAKHYYLAPIYPLLFASGAVGLEAGLARWRATRDRAWPEAAALGVVAVAGAVIAPLVLPVLSPESYLSYERAVGFKPPKTEVAHRAQLPQFLADRYGWEELVAEVARAYHALPRAEQAGTAILTGNYGEAGAINLFGPRHGLPPAISGHQTYWFWGPGDWKGERAIVLQYDREDVEESCLSVEQVGTHSHPWGMEEENGPIWLCRGLKMSVAELWPRLKHWN